MRGDGAMDRSRLIAWGFGLIVCLIVIMIGKGCTDSSINKMQKQKKSAEVVNMGDDITINISTSASETAPPVVTDMFGRPVAVVQTEMITAETETIVTETDIFGNTVTTTENILTDTFGNEVTTTQTDMTDVFGNIVTNQTQTTVVGNPVETTTLSPIDQYNEDLKNPDFMSGFNHGEYEVDEEGNTKPTLPSDFVIIID